MSHSVYVFDAYGTLFDVHAAARKHMSAVGPEGKKLSSIWREKQLEYSWVRSLMGQYVDFWELTVQALDTAFALVPEANKRARDELLAAYWELDCYPEVPQLLKDLRERGSKLAILSNAPMKMMDGALKNAGITDCFDEVFSVDPVQTYKPHPEVYDLVTTHFRLYPEAISFQSSNRWDIAGATKYGMRTVWINRLQMPDEYADLTPSAVLKDLSGLPALG